jgi:hypothetical protein
MGLVIPFKQSQNLGALDNAKAPQWFAGLLFLTQLILSSTNFESFPTEHFLRKVMKSYHQNLLP